jgi:hypothetical protein
LSELKPGTIPFRTKDLNQAAFIWCQPGTELLKVETTRDKNLIVYFLFGLEISEEGLTQLKFDYANGKTRVEPKMYVEKQNALRDLLHSSLGSHKRAGGSR